MVVLVMLVALPALTLSKCNSQATVGAVLFVCVGAVCLRFLAKCAMDVADGGAGTRGTCLDVGNETTSCDVVWVWPSWSVFGPCRLGASSAQGCVAKSPQKCSLQSFFGTFLAPNSCALI
jgi:hypothetical protein